MFTARRSSSRSRAPKATASPKVAERKPTPKSTRKTPTRASARNANANYPLRNKATIDDREVSMKGSHSNVSMSSKKSTGGGWFSKCAIV